MQRFRYALYPHAGTWKDAETMHRGYEMNYPLTATQVSGHTGALPAEHSFASVENPNVTLTAMKKAEDADALIFRMVEWAGKETEVKLHTPPGRDRGNRDEPDGEAGGAVRSQCPVTRSPQPFTHTRS